MTSVISGISICQYFDDLSIMSGTTQLQTDKGSLCAYVNVGDDLTDEETEQVACQLGWCDPDDNVTAGALPENTRPGEGEDEGALASSTKAWFQERLDDLKYGFPYGYLVYLYEAWESYRSSTASTSSTTDFIIGFDVSNFDSGTGIGITNLTASGTPVGTWNMTQAYQDGLDQYDTAGLVDWVDKFLYGIFGLFLVVRIATNAWQHFGQGMEMGARAGRKRFLTFAYDQAQRTRDIGSMLSHGRRKGLW